MGVAAYLKLEFPTHFSTVSPVDQQMFLINFQQIFLVDNSGYFVIACRKMGSVLPLALHTEILKNIVISKHNGKSCWLGLQEYIEVLKLNVVN